MQTETINQSEISDQIDMEVQKHFDREVAAIEAARDAEYEAVYQKALAAEQRIWDLVEEHDMDIVVVYLNTLDELELAALNQLSDEDLRVHVEDRVDAHIGEFGDELDNDTLILRN